MASRGRGLMTLPSITRKEIEAGEKGERESGNEGAAGLGMECTLEIRALQCLDLVCLKSEMNESISDRQRREMR